LILPHQGGGEFFRELDAPQLCCGVLHLGFGIRALKHCLVTANVWVRHSVGRVHRIHFGA
jgi:hypothetical protein